MNAVEITVTIICTFVASSGFWTYLIAQINKRNSQTELQESLKKLLMGIAHDRIIFLGKVYIDRGYITTDEYENLKKYLWEPYDAVGGNGTGAHMMELVDELEIR